MSADQRKTARVSTPQIIVKVSTKDRFRATYLKDLSEGGLFLKAETPLPLGREMVIDLLPPTWTEPLRLKGTVVRCEMHGPVKGMGVKFAQLDEATTARLRALLTEYQDAPPEPPTPPDREAQLVQVLEQLSQLKTQLEQKDEELATERARREQHESRARGLAADLELAQTSHTGTKTVSPQLEELAAELATARGETIELRTKVGELEGEVEAYKQQLDVLEQAETDARKLSAAFADDKTELEARVLELEAKLGAAEEKAATLQGEGEGLDAALQDSNAQLASLEAKLAEAEAKAQAAQDKAGELALTCAELDGQAQAAQDSLTGLGAELELAQAKAIAADTAQSKVAELELRCAELEGEAQAAQSQLATLNAELAEAQARAVAAEAAQSKVTELELRCAELEGEVQAAQSQLAALNAELGEAQGKAEAAAGQLGELEAKALSLQGEGEGFEAALQQANAQIEALEAQAQGSVAERVQLEMALSGAQAELDELRTQVEPLREELEQTRTELSTALKGALEKANGAEARANAAQAEVVQLKAALGKAGAGAASAAEVQSLKQALSQAQTRLQAVVVEHEVELGQAREMAAVVGKRVSELEKELRASSGSRTVPMGAAATAPTVRGGAFDVTVPGVPIQSEPEEPAITIEMDTAVSMPRPEFEKRLRGNEPLRKTSHFSEHIARDDQERAVLGLLEAGERFTELMVLGRGQVTPPVLMETLYALCQAGVLTFHR